EARAESAVQPDAIDEDRTVVVVVVVIVLAAIGVVPAAVGIAVGRRIVAGAIISAGHADTDADRDAGLGGRRGERSGAGQQHGGESGFLEDFHGLPLG